MLIIIILWLYVITIKLHLLCAKIRFVNQYMFSQYFRKTNFTKLEKLSKESRRKKLNDEDNTKLLK